MPKKDPGHAVLPTSIKKSHLIAELQEGELSWVSRRIEQGRFNPEMLLYFIVPLGQKAARGAGRP
jgi:hypothetical protein